MTTPEDVLAFWFSDGPDTWRKAWFARDEAFDAAIRERFGATLDRAAAGALDDWGESPRGMLALAIVMDQFPRNLFRGTARAFATDAQALALAKRAVVRSLDRQLTMTERVFLYLPFEHSEAMADQDVSVALFEGLRDVPAMAKPDGAIDYAWRHRAVIKRFGRYPHRSAALARESTAEEAAWLAAGGGF
jgi:uncharacterized protein (DUF924 family)